MKSSGSTPTFRTNMLSSDNYAKSYNLYLYRGEKLESYDRKSVDAEDWGS